MRILFCLFASFILTCFLTLSAAPGLANEENDLFSIGSPYPGNLFYVGSPIELTFKAFGKARGWVSWTVTDEDGRQIDSGRFLLTKEVTIAPKVQTTGVYEVSCSLRGTNRCIAKTTFAVIHKLFVTERRSEPFGISIDDLIDGKLRQQTLAGKNIFAVCERLGVPYCRVHLFVKKSDATFGETPDARLEEMLKVLEGYKLTPVVVLHSTLPIDISTTPTDDEITILGRYVERLAERYKDRIRIWEICAENESKGIGIGTPAVEGYARLLREAYLRIKGISPGNLVLGCLRTDEGLDYAQTLLAYDCGRYMDAVVVHADTWKDEAHVAAHLSRIRKIFDESGVQKPIWLAGIGAALPVGQGTGDNQAGMLVRMIALSLAEGVERVFCDSCGLLAAGDDGARRQDRTVFEEGYLPRASAVALNQLMYQLNGYSFAGSVYFKMGVEAKLFVKGNDQVLVAWATIAKPIQVELGTTGSDVQITDILGRRRTVSAENSTLRFPVSGEPQFMGLRSPGLLAQAGFDLEVKPIVRGGTSLAVVTLKGITTGFVQRVRVLTPHGWGINPAEAEVSPEGDKATCQFELTVPENITPGEYEVTATSAEGFPMTITKTVSVRDPLALEVYPPSYLDLNRTRLSVQVVNMSHVALRGTLIVSAGNVLGTAEVKAIPPDESRKVEVPISFGDHNKLTSWRINVLCRANGFTAKRELLLHLAPVRKLVGQIHVDGKLSDWANIPPVFTLRPNRQGQIQQRRKGVEDLLAQVWLSWDERWLYVAVNVEDERVVWPASEKTTCSDNLRVGFDPMNDATSRGYDEEDFELLVSKVGGKDKVSVLVGPRTFDPSKVKLAISEVSNGINYELAIPCDVLMRSGLRRFKLIGFSLALGDCDGSSQEKLVELTPGIGTSKDPTAFKDLWLVD